MPWRLIRLWDERFLAISYAFGCNEPGRVVVREEDDAVVVRVLRPPLGEGPRAACASTYRKIIRLDEPLGDRPLLHVV